MDDKLILENKELRERLDTLQTLYDAKCAEYNKINMLYCQIMSSSFWRVTKPVRFCFDGAKFVYSYLFGTGKLKYRYKHNTVSPFERIKQEHTKFNRNIRFSIVTPLYNTPESFLRQMIESVQAQTYKNWELCLADGSDAAHGDVEETVRSYIKKDSRIKYTRLEKNLGISENTNEAIKTATGDYICLFDHDDVLEPSALYYYAVEAENGADFIYCDEDKFEVLGKGFFTPYFKPDFSPDMLRANNYICHFTVFDRKLLDKVGMFRSEFDGSQDHDFILRLSEQAAKTVHIPRLLYHWRVSSASVAADPKAKPYTAKAGMKAVSEHLERVGLKGTVESSPIHPNFYRIRYEIKDNPLVSILIPSCDHTDDLDKCIKSIEAKSTYRNFEIIVIENNSCAETFEYYKTLDKYGNVKVVVYKTDVFNYSAINNFGAQYAKGEHIILLNNDVEVISPSWIEEMLMFSQRGDVGAVGAKLYYPDNTIQHAGVIVGLGGVAGHSFVHEPRSYVGYFGRCAMQQNISAVTAACMMIPMRVWKEVGGLDETFAVAFNDIDLCMRIRKAGYLICFTPYAELYHYESKSRGLDISPEKAKRFNGEVKHFKEIWQKELDAGDPYYNKNLTLIRQSFDSKTFAEIKKERSKNG